VTWYSFIKFPCLNSVANSGPRCDCETMFTCRDLFVSLLFIVGSGNSEGGVSLHRVPTSICSDSVDVGSVGCET
jgi:hypothetical protein